MRTQDIAATGLCKKMRGRSEERPRNTVCLRRFFQSGCIVNEKPAPSVSGRDYFCLKVTLTVMPSCVMLIVSFLPSTFIVCPSTVTVSPSCL